MNRTQNKPWDSKRVGHSATALFLLCFAAYTFSYIGRKNFDVCLPAMVPDGVITKQLGGYINTVYMIIYGTGQLVSGVVGSRVRPQYMIGLGLLGAGLMNIAMGLGQSPAFLMVAWGLNGAFQSMLWAPIVRVFTDQLPAERRYRAGVNIAVSCPAGTVIAYLIPALFLRIADWRVTFLVCGGGILAAFLVWTCGNLRLKSYLAIMDEECRRLRAEKAAAAGTVSVGTEKARKPMPLVAVIWPSGLLLVVLCLVCNGALRDAVSAWVPTFFTEQFGLAPGDSAVLSVVVPVVSVSGAYVATWLDRRFLHNELFTGGAMFAASAVCILGICLVNGHSPLLCAVCIAIAISAMWGANTMFLTMLPYHFADLGLSASVTGFLNCVIYFSSAACTAVYGIASDGAGWTTLVLIWLGIACVGVLFCFLFGIIWGRKAKLLDEGKLSVKQ